MMVCLSYGLECRRGQSWLTLLLCARAASAWQLARHKLRGIGFARIGGEKRKEIAANESECEATNDAQIM